MSDMSKKVYSKETLRQVGEIFSAADELYSAVDNAQSPRNVRATISVLMVKIETLRDLFRDIPC